MAVRRITSICECFHRGTCIKLLSGCQGNFRKLEKHSEVLKFFGIFILSTRFEFSNKSELWATEPKTKYIPAPILGRTGITKQRFTTCLAVLLSVFSLPTRVI